MAETNWFQQLFGNEHKGSDTAWEQSQRMADRAQKTIEDLLYQSGIDLGEGGLFATLKRFENTNYNTGRTQLQDSLTSNLSGAQNAMGRTGLQSGEANRKYDDIYKGGLLQLGDLSNQHTQGLYDIEEKKKSSIWDTMNAVNQIQAYTESSFINPNYEWNYKPNMDFYTSYVGR